MKKLILLVCLFVGIGLSANVMAADTAINPYIGSTHAYQVNGSLGTYVWKLTTAQDGTGTDLIGAASGAGVVAIGTNGSNSISLTWDNPTIGTTYYLHVLVTGENNCVNRKAITIIPVNSFALDIANVNATNASVLANPFADCAPDVTGITWTGTTPPLDLTKATTFTYNYGTSTFYFRIKANGINFTNTAWTADFTVAETVAATSTVTVHYVTGADDTATPAWGSATLGAIGDNSVVVPANNKVLFVRVTIANSTTNETLTAEDITTTLKATSKENATNLVATSLGTSSTVQTIKARPNAGAITTP